MNFNDESINYIALFIFTHSTFHSNLLSLPYICDEKGRQGGGKSGEESYV